MDANSGIPWSEMDIRDLKQSIAYGDTIEDTASFLCRDVPEVRQKAEEIGCRIWYSISRTVSDDDALLQ